MKSKGKFFGFLVLFLFIFPQLALAKRPLPRVLVYLKGEDVDTAQSNTEEILQEAGFKIFDRDQLQNIKEVDAALSTNDKGKLKALKHRYGIEVIVAGKCKKSNKQERRIYGRVYTYFKPYVTMRAIVADTAEIIYSKSMRGTETARSNAVDKLAKQLAAIMAEKMKAYWAKAAFQQASFDVVISKCSFKNLSALEIFLKGRPRVLSTARRSYAKKTAFIEVAFRGGRGGLESALLKCETPKLKIVRTTANRIEAEVTHGAVVVVPNDTTPPTIEIVTPKANSYTNQRKVMVMGKVWDNMGIKSVQVNGVAATVKNKSFFTYVKTREGRNTFVATAWDLEGNNARSSVSIFVDTTPPALKITHPVAGKLYNKKFFLVRGTVQDPLLQSVMVQGALAKVKNGHFFARVAANQDGVVTIVAVAKDMVGNTAYDQVSVIVDSTPPQVTFNVVISGTVDKPGSRVWVNGKEVKVHNGRWRASVDISTVKKIIIEAVDTAGNRSVRVRNLGQ